MDELLLILHGYCTIQLWRKIGGSNWHPHTIELEVCGNTLVDEGNYYVLNQDCWFKRWDTGTQSYYAHRKETIGGKGIAVPMARAVLCLSMGAGNVGVVADHKNHDTLDNRAENLRIATRSQSNMHRRKWGSSSRFKGVHRNKKGWRAQIFFGGFRIQFPTVSMEVEAALMRKEAEMVIHGEFVCSECIPEDEMPSEQGQKEIREIVGKELKVWGFECH